MKDEVTHIIILIREERIFVDDLIKVHKDRIPTPKTNEITFLFKNPPE